jgi:hypothetical protein
MILRTRSLARVWPVKLLGLKSEAKMGTSYLYGISLFLSGLHFLPLLGVDSVQKLSAFLCLAHFRCQLFLMDRI